MKYSTTLLFFLLLILFSPLTAQYEGSDVMPEITPASIPSSPAFSLLGVNPEVVTRPSDVKEFKVDWRIKNYKLAPDLALEAQPIWWFHYKNKGLKRYQEASPLAKVLSTLSVSLATAKIDNVNHMSYALKLNVFKEKDPLLDMTHLKKKEEELNLELSPYAEEIETLLKLRTGITDINEMQEIDSTIASIESDIMYLKKSKMSELKAESEAFAQDNWNMDMIDVAFGKVYKYDNGGIDSLNFANAGYGIWINAAKGIGKKGMLTGLVKMNHIGENNNIMWGASYRHGSERFNFFIETVRTKMNNNLNNGFAEEEVFADLRSADLGTAWYQFEEGEGYTMWTLSYGGDFRLSNNILLNFALRTEFKDGFSFDKFLPIANIVCLMN